MDKKKDYNTDSKINKIRKKISEYEHRHPGEVIQNINVMYNELFKRVDIAN